MTEYSPALWQCLRTELKAVKTENNTLRSDLMFSREKVYNWQSHYRELEANQTKNLIKIVEEFKVAKDKFEATIMDLKTERDKCQQRVFNIERRLNKKTEPSSNIAQVEDSKPEEEKKEAAQI